MILGAERKRVEHELGVFGIGMKLSALAQANQVSIVSQQSGNYCTRRIDASYIIEKNENHIIVLDEGEIIEKGTHNELINNNGFYAEMHKKQTTENL
jgi:ATP-binding cassette subfamily B protein